MTADTKKLICRSYRDVIEEAIADWLKDQPGLSPRPSTQER